MHKNLLLVVSLSVLVVCASTCKPRRVQVKGGSGVNATGTPTSADDTEYKVDDKNQLMKRDKDGNWVVVDKDVKSFQKSKNGDVFIVTTNKKLKMMRNGVTTPMGDFGDKAVLMLNDSAEPSAATMALGDVEPPPQEYLPDDLTEYKIGSDGVLLKKAEGEADWSVFTFQQGYQNPLDSDGVHVFWPDPPPALIPGYHPSVLSRINYRCVDVKGNPTPNPHLDPSYSASKCRTGSDILQMRLPGSTEFTPLTPASRYYPMSGGSGALLVEKLQNVVSFQKAPNGYLYVLGSTGEMRLIRYGLSLSIFYAGLESLSMDQDGTAHWLHVNDQQVDNWSPNKTKVLPPIPLGEDVFCLTPPSPGMVMKAAHMTSRDQYFEPLPGESAAAGVFPDPKSPFSNVRVVVEPNVDRLDEPKLYPGIGMGRAHQCQYKATIWYDQGSDSEPRVHQVFIGLNDIIRMSPAPAPLEAETRLSGASVISLPIIPKAAIFHDSMSVSTGAEGVIYKLGVVDTVKVRLNLQSLGVEPPPRELWRLPRGAASWLYEGRAYSFAESAEGTLFVLNASNELKSLSKGSNQWRLLDKKVQAFSMTPSGILYKLNFNGILMMLAPGSNKWTRLDHGVESFLMAPDGTLTELNNRRQLRRFTGSKTWSTLDTGVLSVEWAADGLVYELNTRRQLKRLAVSGVWTTLDTNVTSFRRDLQGVLYSLNAQHELKQLRSVEYVEADDPVYPDVIQKTTLKWRIIATNVHSFVVAPTQFNDVYVLFKSRVLYRLDLQGWMTLRSGIRDLKMDPDGLVRAVDIKNTTWLFAPTYMAPILEPVDGDVFCTEPPLPDKILKAAHVTPGRGVSVVIEPRVDSLSGIRWSLIGSADHVDPTSVYFIGSFPVRVHRCRYQGTVTFDRTLHRNPVNIHVDEDRIIRAQGPTTSL